MGFTRHPEGWNYTDISGEVAYLLAAHVDRVEAGISIDNALHAFDCLWDMMGK
jgi:hypothetical protein